MIKSNILFYSAAATTAIAGIIHIILGIDARSENMLILFIVGGIAQIFWVIPMIRRWGPVWYSVGLGGTIIFILIYVITRMPENFITGRAGKISDNGILTEVFQIAFVAIVIAILAWQKKASGKSTQD